MLALREHLINEQSWASQAASETSLLRPGSFESCRGRQHLA